MLSRLCGPLTAFKVNTALSSTLTASLKRRNRNRQRFSRVGSLLLRFRLSSEVTSLGEELTSRCFKTVYCVVLVYDYCVGSTELDAAKLGIETYKVSDATKSKSPASEEKI